MIIAKNLFDEISQKIAEHWDHKDTEVEVGITSPINRTQFRKCLEHMMSVGDTQKEHDEMLDIIMGQRRYTVTGKTNISAYCKNEQERGIFSSVIIKQRKEKIDMDEYGCRFRVSKEVPVAIAEWNLGITPGADKQYRIKKRFSVTFGTSYVVDFTIVKAGSGKAFKGTRFAETYEIEIEYVRESSKRAPKVEVMLDLVEEVLKSLRDELHISRFSEKGAVISEYLAVIGMTASDAMIKSAPRKLFVGPQPVTMDISNVAVDSDTSIYKDYSVTEKADGQRYLVFVNKVGKVYLVNSRLEIKATGLTDSALTFGSSIFDCECITVADGQIYILLFDAYFVKGKAVHTKMLSDRLQKAQVFAESFVASTSGYSVFCKKFYMDDVFKGAATILKQEFAYKIDGLIYTPINVPAPMGGTWHSTWKWKPVEDSTIDFLVMFQRFDTGDDMVSDGKKTLLLYVGSILVGPREYFEKAAKGYNAKLFTPSGSGSSDMVTWKTLVECDDKGVVKCENGEEIVHKSVVEMRWQSEAAKGSGGGQWVPMRVRHDKTAEGQGGKVITANSLQNAEAVWRTIVSPISKRLILGKDKLYVKDIEALGGKDESRYYAREDVDRNKSLTFPMLNFHNNWVKNKSLIGKFAGKSRSLLDLACGKAGDMSKWVFNGFTTVLGVDIFEDNIINNANGAYKRLMDIAGKLPPGSKYAFVPMDSSRVIDAAQINEIKDDYMKKLARCIWGLDKPAVVPSAYRYLADMAKSKFDVVSIQFALHYFFESEAKFDALLQNIDNHIKPGGFFIGTCFDGAAISELLGDAEERSGTKEGQTIWSIKKGYKGAYNPKKFGQKIEVYVETINKNHTEYLVGYDLLVKHLARYNIHPLTPKECAEYGFNESWGRFGTLFNRMIEANKDIIDKRNDDRYKDNNVVTAYKMIECEDERTFSFANMWFAFRKARK